jgi:hypothetical protein
MTSQMNLFMTDEYVLAYHGPLLYEARVSSFFPFFRLLSCFSPSLGMIGVEMEGGC